MQVSSTTAHEEESLPRIPDLRVAQNKFLLQSVEPKNDSLKKSLLRDMEDKEMAPFYAETCRDLGWKVDEALLGRLKAKNEAKLKELQEKLETVEKNEGESEIREALQAKTEYLAQIGDKDAAIEAAKKTMEKTVGIGNRMDLVFTKIRIGLFFMDHALIESNVAKAKQMLEEGGDWDRRNRLKVYEGLYAMSVRDFSKAADLFLEGVSTFTSYELMSYVDFVNYTVLIGVIALSRRHLLEKVVQGSEILEVLHDQPMMRGYLMSFYECQYGSFFSKLADIEHMCKRDRYLNPHYAFYVREMKVKAYSQLLESYRSLTLKYMADSFNVTEDYMDKELCRFIADGRLHCKVDKVQGIVITNRPDSKNAQYQAIIKQGDILLNRVQKLSRVINI